MSRRRIALPELVRLRRALERFEAKVEGAYPGYLRDGSAEADASHDMSETVRNAATALAHVVGWISYRERTGGDPFEQDHDHAL